MKENIKLKKQLDNNLRDENARSVVPLVSVPSSSKTSESEVFCSICANPIIGFKAKYFFGEAFNPACNKCDDSFEGDNSGPDPDGCMHSPVCIVRQPLPPPAPAVTHLVNEQSKYHEHMMSVRGVPGRYGAATGAWRLTARIMVVATVYG